MPQEIKQLQSTVSIYCKERDWNKFHTPKNLLISIEAAKIQENFQWANKI